MVEYFLAGRPRRDPSDRHVRVLHPAGARADALGSSLPLYELDRERSQSRPGRRRLGRGGLAGAAEALRCAQGSFIDLVSMVSDLPRSFGTRSEWRPTLRIFPAPARAFCSTGSAGPPARILSTATPGPWPGNPHRSRPA